MQKWKHLYFSYSCFCVLYMFFLHKIWSVVSAHIWCSRWIICFMSYIDESVRRRNQWQLKKMSLSWQLNWPLTFEIRVPAAVSVSTVFSRGYVLITCRRTRRTSPKHSWTAGLLHGSSFTAETWENSLIQGDIWKHLDVCFKQITCFL